MSEITVIKGLSDLQAVLDSLPAKIEANIMRGALRAGAKVMQADAKARCPVAPANQENQTLYGGRLGLLRDTIRIGTRLSNGTVVAKVVAGGKTKSGGDAYYAHFVEYGTRPHVIRAVKGRSLIFGVAAVSHPGAKAKPFMRPALDTNVLPAMFATAEYIRKRLADKHGIEVPAPLEDGDE